MKAASKVQELLSGFVITICSGPGLSGGVVTINVFMSLKVVAADFPFMETLAPDWKPLHTGERWGAAPGG